MKDQRTYVLPAEPLPVRLMNTVWAERGALHDDLADREGLEAWLRAIGTSVAPATDRHAEAARRLRDAVRAAAGYITHDERAIAGRTDGLEAALEVINGQAALSPADRLAVGANGFTREAPSVANGPEEALARVAAAAVQFFTGPLAEDLRACMGPRCVLYFVKDHPRREWCDGACGNRARASRYYHRHRNGE